MSNFVRVRILSVVATAFLVVLGLFIVPASAASTDEIERLALAQQMRNYWCVDAVDDALTTAEQLIRESSCSIAERELEDSLLAQPTTTPPATTTPPPTTTPPATTPPPTTTVLPTTAPPTTTIPPTTTPPPSAGEWPTRETTGTPPGWVPSTTRTTDLQVTQPGAVVEDIRLIGANIIVLAPNVTIRRVELLGGRINNAPGNSCGNGLVVEDSRFAPMSGQARGGSGEGAITYGGYTARRVEIVDRIEGLRVSGRSTGCGPVLIEDSYIHINDGGDCSGHADGIQGYDGAGLTVRDTFIDGRQLTCGTAAIFYPNGDGNIGPVVIDHVWAAANGWTIRVGPPNTKITGLTVLWMPRQTLPDGVPGSHYGPLDCVPASNVTITNSFEVREGEGSVLSAVLRC